MTFPAATLAIPSRRGFIMAAGALTVAVNFGSSARADTASTNFTANAWVSVGSDDIVSITFALAEMGQGIKTTLPLLIAEELDADWDKVRVVQSPSDVKTYGAYGVLGTFGSESTAANFERLRLVGAQTRRILMLAAAGLWTVPLAELTTEPGRVVHMASKRAVSYGDLAGIARVPDPAPVLTKADLKPADQFRYIGKPLPRIDVPSKVNGSAVYGIDVQLEGMLYAAVSKPVVQGETPGAVDDVAARAIKGVVKIVTLPHGVGVIAETVEAAMKGKAALAVQWSNVSAARAYSDPAVLADYAKLATDNAQSAIVMIAEADAAAAIAAAKTVISADYFSDHVAHLTMEPMNATGRVKDGVIEIWASNQSPSSIQRVVGAAAGVAQETIVVHSTLLGGGFGRRYEADFAVDAYLLAKETAQRAVKVIWSREDDVRNDPYRPLTAQHIDVGLDALGEIAGWRHRVVCSSYLGRLSAARLEKMAGKDGVVAGAGQFKYRTKAHLVDYVRQERGVGVGALRGISSGYMRFAIEGMIDQLAAVKGVDPLAYRLDLLKDDPRGLAVLRKTAAMADWTRPRPDRGLGLAYSDDLQTRLAMIAEISLDKTSGEIKVHAVWCAVDAGLVVQPLNIAAQIEGGLMFGLGPALFEQIHIKRGEVAESNFGDYRVLRMSDIPEVLIEVIASDNPPSGVGEAGVIPIAPAIANAFAQLTGGKRLRHLPMLPDRVKAALA